MLARGGRPLSANVGETVVFLYIDVEPREKKRKKTYFFNEGGDVRFEDMSAGSVGFIYDFTDTLQELNKKFFFPTLTLNSVHSLRVYKIYNIHIDTYRYMYWFPKRKAP